MTKYVVYMLLSMLALHSSANATPTIRIATLQYGTVNWEIDVIRRYKLDEKYNFSLEVMPVSSKNSSAVALQSQAVDIIFSDWIWVNRQRFNKKPYQFFPVSAAAGGVYVQKYNAANTLSDLINLKIGVAGGPVDKSWLILQIYAKRLEKFDISRETKPVFAAAPLLNKLMYDDKLDAVINFWHYSARLKAMGFKQIISVEELLVGLGFKSKLPVVGWVFDESFAAKKPEALNGFLLASREARIILKNSDEEWERIRSLIHAENDQVFTELKNKYREGLLEHFDQKQIEELAELYLILSSEGGWQLTGGASELDPAIFYLPEIMKEKVRYIHE